MEICFLVSALKNNEMKKLTLIVLLLFFGITFVVANDYSFETEQINVLKLKLDGKWKASIESPNGNVEFTIDYKVEGKKLSGTISSAQGELKFTDGAISGKNFEYTLELNGTKHTHKGTLDRDTVTIIIVLWSGKVNLLWIGLRNNIAHWISP